MPRSTKILVLGGTGMVGSAVCHQLYWASHNNEITATYNQQHGLITKAREDCKDINWKRLQIEHYDRSAFWKLYETIKPDIIVNCLLGQDEYRHLIDAWFPHGLPGKVIHISTNAVFPLEDKLWEVSHIPRPTSDYGKNKLTGEVPKHLVLRCSVMGVNLWDPKPEELILKFVTNQKWNGITNLELANEIQRIIGEDTFKPGVRHVHSSKVNHRYKIATWLAKAFELPLPSLPSANEKSVRASTPLSFIPLSFMERPPILLGGGPVIKSIKKQIFDLAEICKE